MGETITRSDAGTQENSAATCIRWHPVEQTDPYYQIIEKIPFHFEKYEDFWIVDVIMRRVYNRRTVLARAQASLHLYQVNPDTIALVFIRWFTHK